ncbi:Cullin-domain-containing protein [Aspergillus ellipticus CBS 707.79]|uniref:Cullin-domain-containing protein n=1 Tax=Aspergillus ellipticus CBS 707.79 TaxID=1448320 RepID=A0A319D8W7_9EURO|nr:Cullin-domain-containing protein [Aspergillus ellipticus CBS 707.79]
MEDRDSATGLRGLYQDLSALSSSSFVNIERLRVELETHIEDFKKLLDKPAKNNTSRQAVLSGKITVDNTEYEINGEFQQGVLLLADALNIDELQAAMMFMAAQEDAHLLDRPPVITAIMRFHERRQFLLDSLRLIFQESFEVERETTQVLMQEMLAFVVEIKDGPLRNASLFTRKCMTAMADIESWLVLLGEHVQKASIVGQSEEFDIMEALEYQRNSLQQQHESLGAVLCYLFKGPYTSSEDLRLLLDHLKKLERLDGLLVHYMPCIISSFVQHGSPESSSSYREARSLHTAITSSKDVQPWKLPTFHSAVITLWLAVYSGWDFDGSASPLQEVDLDKDAEERTKMFMTALDDGGLELILAICYGVNNEEWADSARSELVTLLLKESASSMLESDDCSDFLKVLLMENFEAFAEACIANMPDAVRMLKTEEDSQRLDHLTALRDGLTSSLHRGLVEARTHLESFLMIMAFAFEHRPDSAQEFWADPDGNLYGFLQWASKRQTVPRVSAFCELLCSISVGEENATAAHRFLSEEDSFMSAKLKRTTSMNWTQMFAELELYAARVTEKPSSTSPTILRSRKLDPADMSEPESPVMLTCYLRLLEHLSKQSAAIRDFLLRNASFNIVGTLLTLCSGPVPTHLRANVFSALAALMTERTPHNGNEMWLSIDQWISGGSMSTPGLGKVPIVSNPLVWHEQQAFQRIGESFDQANAFVRLVYSLVLPTTDTEEYHLSLPFPETLGSSYRMPGIEPYIDFVMGQALSRKVPDLNERQTRLLTYNCLDFIVTCLKSFNENLVTVLSQAAISSDTVVKTSEFVAYVRMHPFSRVAEWLFNEDVIKAIFATAHQDVTEVAKASSDSILVLSLVRSLEVMDMIIDLQSTYYNIVRPAIKSQAGGSRTNVANSSLSSFEDSILNNLTLIPALCLYCSTGHQQLTVTSMALLEKLSSSPRLNKITSPELSRWRSSNKIVEVLSAEVDLNSVSRPLVSQMQPEARELESGPQSPGYIIRESLLALLNSCLSMINERPTVAHLLLGFSSIGSILDVSPGGLFADKMSLLHAIIGFLQSYPDELNGNILPWLVHLKRMAFGVLKHLWSSKLSSYFTLAEMRGSRFLLNMFASQPIIGPNTPWDGLPIIIDEFWISDSTTALAEFLLFRSYLFDYAATEIRSATKLGSPTLQAEILSILFGNSVSETGETILNPSVFDLFDFADLDIRSRLQPPPLSFLGDVEFDVCATAETESSPAIYNLDELAELIQVRKQDLKSGGSMRASDEELFAAESHTLMLFFQSTNQANQIAFNRFLALRSWTELLTTMLTCSEIEGGRQSTFILHSLQLILPKLEAAIEEDLPEGIELARLAETLVSGLDATESGQNLARRSGDILDEKLHQLFQVCVRGVILANGNVAIRETFYNTCAHYMTRIIPLGPAHQSMKLQSQQVIKAAGNALIEAVCDDAYAGQETCRVSALLFLNLLAALDRQADGLLAESMAQSNYLSLFLDTVRVLPVELRNAQATARLTIVDSDTPLLLSYYQSLLSLLQELCQTKSGAIHVLKTGLFQAVRDSQLFAADPDLGIDIDNPDALRKYYDLLGSVLRVVVAAIFSRGLHNEQMMEQTRAFLAENRQSMVGIFKRFAKIGGAGATDHHDALRNLTKSYMALVTATDFLADPHTPWILPTLSALLSTPSPRTEPGRCSRTREAPPSRGARKLPDQEEASQQPQQQQATISELLSRHHPTPARGHSHPTSPTSKRLRLSPPSPGSVYSSHPQEPNSSDRMYNFANAESKSGGPVGQSGSGAGNPMGKPRTFNATSRQSNFTPHTGAKRLVVKNLRTGSRLNQDSYLEKVWGQLDAALSAVFDGGKPEQSLEELYKGAENVCRQQRSAALAKRLQDRCREHVSGKLRDRLVAKAEGGTDIDILRTVVEAWSLWQSKLVTIRWIFYYLDQSFLLHSKDFPTIREMGLIQFRQHIFSDAVLQPKILQGACDLVEADRAEEQSIVADPPLLRKSIELFHSLDIYTSGFEPLLVSESSSFFSSWAKREASGYLATFAENSHRLIECEVNRCELFSLNRSTKQKLSELLDQALVSDQEDALLCQGDILGLLRTGNKIALERLYSLLQRKDLGAKLKTSFSRYIIEEGAGIVFDREKEADMIARLLDFKQQLDDIWINSFHRNEELGHTLREAFETFMNKGRKSESTGGTDNPKTGEMIAKYVDRLLKGGWKLAPPRQTDDRPLADEDAEIDRQLDQVLDLFRFVHGKAVFEAFYKNDLARRLLMGRSASDDAEKSMLSRLKTECGSSFTHNLESMFKDMDVARDEMTAYSSIQRERQDRLPVDLSVSVLSAAAWPTYSDAQVRIPPEIATAVDDFEKFYHTKYNGRKLDWKHQLAHCQLRSRFPKGDKELVVSSFQAIVLLLFNDVPEGGVLGYRQIQEATTLSDQELKRTLQSLACAKYRVLNKKPKGRDVDTTDEFSYNAGFTDPKMRIKINQIQLKETKEENKTTHERVAADRHYETQAAIVRIMKSRKTITYPELVAEVIQATRSRGVLEVPDIKKNIDKLIEKDYMEREEGNRYQYVA